VDAGGGYGPGEGGVGGTDGGHTCGVTTDNRALCWGEGQHGQNGDGTLILRKAPVLVAGGLTFRSVSVGIYHVCGVTTGSVPYCWGWNWVGVLGDGTLVQRNTPKAVAGGHFFRQVSAGGGHTCAVTAGNVAWCWGIGSAVGDGTNSIRKMPVKVVGPS
jgi:alpha-tubulin suppressor-like RCC1 family protein